MNTSPYEPAAARVMLVFPPPWLPVQPYIALPALQAALKEAGLGPVAMYDLNVHTWEDLIDEGHLSHCLDRCQRAQGGPNGLDELTRATAIGPYAVAHVDEAKAVLRDSERFYEYDRFAWSIRVLMEALHLVSAAHYPTHWSFIRFGMRYRYSVPEMAQAVRDRAENPFLEYFERQALPRIAATAPQLLGISVTCQDQAIPALTLARLVREQLPQTRIVMGGAYFTGLVKEMHESPELLEWADFFVVNEGESALVGLASAIAEGREPLNVPNLIYQGSGRVHQTRFVLEDVARLPCPDYDGLPWHLYLSPEPVFHLQTSRSCYWNRCAFCAHTRVNLDERYRQRSLDQVTEDVGQLVDRHGARYFTFWDEAMAPATLRRMSQRFIQTGLDVRWTAITRFEKAFLDGRVFQDLFQAGCRQVEFGYESGVQHVLDAMQKGTDVQTMSPILRAAHEAGLSISMLAMVGFPGETREDAERSLRFILDHADLIDHVFWGRFVVCKHSAVERDPDRYGLRLIPVEGPLALRQEWSREPTAPGMDSPEAQQVAARHAAQCDEAGITDTNARTGAHYLLYQDKYDATSPHFTDRRPQLDEQQLMRARLSEAEGLIVAPMPAANGRTDYLIFQTQNGRTLRVSRTLRDLIEGVQPQAPGLAKTINSLIEKGVINVLSP